MASSSGHFRKSWQKMSIFRARVSRLKMAATSGTNLSSATKIISPEWVKDQNGSEHYVARTNVDFERFYRAQNTCSTEEERQECLEAMRRDLNQERREKVPATGEKNQSNSQSILSQFLNQRFVFFLNINLNTNKKSSLFKCLYIF